MPTVAVHGVDLYYEERGNGASILGIHGTPSSAVFWEEAAAALAAHGRCLTYDRRGFFRSQPSTRLDSVDLADHVDDAVALLTSLAATPAVVIGRSTGGLIALELVRRFPEVVTSLVLLEPAVFTLDPRADAWARQLRSRLLEAARRDPSSAAAAVFREALGAAAWEGLPGTLRRALTGTSPAVLAELNGHGLDLSENPLVLAEGDLAGITHPTLVVSSEDGPEACRLVNDRLAAALPHAEAALVTGGHLIHPAHPVVLDFLSRTIGAAAP